MSGTDLMARVISFPTSRMRVILFNDKFQKSGEQTRASGVLIRVIDSGFDLVYKNPFHRKTVLYPNRNISS
jgi:hypothetical protein